MKALILNGAYRDDKNTFEIGKAAEEKLLSSGYEVEEILLCEKEVGACLGCFGCWIKTPGVCVIDDYGREIAEKVINSNLVVWLTPVVFGGYSSELKKALDRIIPLILPFFRKVEGEIHHKARYDKYPDIIVLGIMGEENRNEEVTFNSLVKRNSLNFPCRFSGGTINCKSEKGIKLQLEEKLSALEVKAC